jgi:kynurenine formamidase
MKTLFTVSVTLDDWKAYADLSSPTDIGITPGLTDNVNCFHAPELSVSPFTSNDFIGDTRFGSPVNFMNIQCNPHGNGTHTECVGHISEERIYLTDCMQDFHFVSFLTSITPENQPNGDQVITLSSLEKMKLRKGTKGLIIRTLPNDEQKRQRKYSDTNPPFIMEEAIQWMVHHNIEHLLVDLPSIDKEQDGGKLLAHKSFWQFPFDIRKKATITELIYVPNHITDGYYLVNLQFYPFPMDASPSRPLLFPLHETPNAT